MSRLAAGRFRFPPLEEVSFGEPAAAAVAGLDDYRIATAADGVGPERFELIARNSLHDRWLHGNPRKVRGAEDVVAILRIAA